MSNSADLSYRATTYRYFLKFLEDFVERPLENAFYDSFSMPQGMGFSARMQRSETVAQQGWK